ncbi:GTPase-associated system all-helical protein GASH [Janthinobacterium sp. Mn2066]|uniref:GTPase-associated system all-helical protein GASH n=1 Tax=Janthinobacterium sp. Mn2066 TaxID=3395264 RepID=UPI003BC0BDF7
MNKMGEYARILNTGIDDDWVEKRKRVVDDLKLWYAAMTHASAISNASNIAASIVDGSTLPDAIAIVGETTIQKHASSFVRSDGEGILQIKVMLFAAAIDFVNAADEGGGWEIADALAAAFWSALWFQPVVAQTKVERLRQDLLEASRARVLRSGAASRRRRPIPSIGPVNVDQDSVQGVKVNNAFSRAVEPMLTVVRDNAALDREELDFMWWLMSDRSDILDEPLRGLPSAVRAVVAGLDAAAKLRKLPADAHRHIVFRHVDDSEPLTLAEIVGQLEPYKEKITVHLNGLSSDCTAVFPLITAIVSGTVDHTMAEAKIRPSEWGARALLEGAIHNQLTGTAGGL